MKFSCSKEILQKIISIAYDVISERSALSIMSNVLLEATEKELCVKASDSNVSFESAIPVECEEEGTAIVFCDKLLEILSTLPDGDITLEKNDARVILKSLKKDLVFELRTIANEKYPEIFASADQPTFSMKSKDFKELIDQVIFAVSTDDTRYFMNGVLLELSSEGLVMVGTNGRRLSYVKLELDNTGDSAYSIIIPPKALTIISKRISGEGQIDFYISNEIIRFKFNNYLLSSNLINGQGPNYRKVMPEKQDYKAVVNTSSLNDAIKTVSILVDRNSNRVMLSFTKNMLEIYADESELGSATARIPCDYDGVDTKIAFNRQYFYEPLHCTTSEMVSLEFTAPDKVVSILPVSAHQYRHIVMPMSNG